ncbi:zinc finger protein 765-like [Artemia franciscana]|uniref:C2H2-type domain-containing protein n=1 Tax=Artemia franciscana TaxID=6661 RepID=A0AA88I7C7_ARTSF|nr:hypothetical protein QYM36_002403 [Artemia franciscana]
MYECSVCKKILTRSGGLVNHFRLHTNEKPFKCVHCSVYFRTKDARRRHEISHLKGEDRYQICEICGKKYRREYLSTHKKDHTGHNCTICGCHFSTGGILKKHRKEHLKTTENAIIDIKVPSEKAEVKVHGQIKVSVEQTDINQENECASSRDEPCESLNDCNMAEPAASRNEPYESMNDSVVQYSKNFVNQATTNVAEPPAGRDQPH